MSRKPAKSARKPSRNWTAIVLTLLAIPVTAFFSLLLVTALALLLANDRLPPLDALIDYRPRIPLRIYTADGALIGEFGEERRAVVRIDAVPAVMKQAILAAEDERFYRHQGVDYVGVIRAAYSNLLAGGKRQGASTIT
ncbi:MAG TPA: transglycosylase domain-containing protein, partial [Sphingomonadaceae bacterium]|nr:transglycosylase domain-containing protein [Sphingomonadaceae bacterium]